MEGGRHAAWGPCNALVGLGPRCHLEILAPDSAQSAGPAEGSSQEGCVKDAVDGAMKDARKVIEAKRSALPAK
jgi:hypothetical protein